MAGNSDWYTAETAFPIVQELIDSDNSEAFAKSVVKHLNLAFEKGKQIGSGGADTAISQIQQEHEHDLAESYHRGWSFCAKRAVEICNRRASNDRHIAIKAEASKCAAAIEFWCVTDRDEGDKVFDAAKNQ